MPVSWRSNDFFTTSRVHGQFVTNHEFMRSGFFGCLIFHNIIK